MTIPGEPMYMPVLAQECVITIPGGNSEKRTLEQVSKKK